MAQPYTRRFGAGFSPSAGELVLLTASAAWTWIVRDIVITNQHGSEQLVQVFIRAGSATFLLYVNPAAASTTSYHLELRQELLAGEQLVAYGSAGPFNVLVTGYALHPPT